MNTIAVIDYGMGNLHSVSKALKKVSPSDQILVTSKKSEIENKENPIQFVLRVFEMIIQ